MNGRAGGRWLSYLRPVLVMTKGPKATGLPAKSVSDAQTVRLGSKDFHKWEQPLRPFVAWLEMLSHPGDLVVDPYAGSGTTGLAAKQTGRRWIGCEIDPDHYRVARGRLSASN